jgi:FkbM family methyltransferase
MSSYLPEGNTFYYYGYCEANVTSFLLCYLREGMVVIDVGAHVGIYTMLSSALVGETGKVYGFEPTPSTYEVLKKNSEKLTNVHIENVAVAAEVGTTSFLDYGPGYGAYNTASTAGGQGLSKEAKNITVPTTTLDTYCRENGVSPTLIKLDAEGFESAILKGSRLILQQNNRRRPLIILEVAGGASWDTNRKDSFSILENAEYVPYSISADGTLTKHLYRDTYTYDNLLFIPNELVTEVTNTVL